MNQPEVFSIENNRIRVHLEKLIEQAVAAHHLDPMKVEEFKDLASRIVV
jgi:hypothetical protein